MKEMVGESPNDRNDRGMHFTSLDFWTLFCFSDCFFMFILESLIIILDNSVIGIK